MKISEEKINEVREATDIVELISQYVSLKQKGNSYFGLCPFHQEKTPSFHVDPARGFYHCFGCNEGGNVFSFIMKMDRVSFPEAVKMLAAKANIDISIEQSTESHEVELLYHVNKMAAGFFRECFIKTNAGRKASQYLYRRGFDETLAEKFMIGYAPNLWDGLIQKAQRDSVPLENLQKAGLIISRRDGKSFYDRFRGRIMFPILNTSGRVVGFGGRAVEAGKGIPKYLNSPETKIYRKSHILYGLYQSREGIRKEDKVLVVEGYTDLIRLHQASLPYGVATAGTALTEGHANLIARFTKNVILIYDADSAGFSAAIRGAEQLIASGLNVRVVSLPKGMDPDLFLREKQTGALLNLISQSESIVEFMLNRKRLDQKLATPSDKSQAASHLLATIVKVKDPVERQLMIHELAESLEIDEKLLHDKLRKMKHSNGADSAWSEVRTETARERAEKTLLRLILTDPRWQQPVFKHVGPEDFDHPQYHPLVKWLYTNYQKQGPVQEPLTAIADQPKLHRTAIAFISDPLNREVDYNQLGMDCILYIKEEKVRKAIREIREKMRRAKGNETQSEKYRDQWLDLNKKREELRDTFIKCWKKDVEKL
jgi:DNA primase